MHRLEDAWRLEEAGRKLKASRWMLPGLIRHKVKAWEKLRGFLMEAVQGLPKSSQIPLDASWKGLSEACYLLQRHRVLDISLNC